jgi:hypothetical protein
MIRFRRSLPHLIVKPFTQPATVASNREHTDAMFLSPIRSRRLKIMPLLQPIWPFTTTLAVSSKVVLCHPIVVRGSTGRHFRGRDEPNGLGTSAHSRCSIRKLPNLLAVFAHAHLCRLSLLYSSYHECLPSSPGFHASQASYLLIISSVCTYSHDFSLLSFMFHIHISHLLSLLYHGSIYYVINDHLDSVHRPPSAYYNNIVALVITVILYTTTPPICRS